MTSLGGPQDVDVDFEHLMQKPLLLHYASPNVLRKILKSQLLYILTVLENGPADVLKTAQKNAHGMKSLARLQDVNFEPLVQMHFNCIISRSVCLKH